MVHAHIDIVAGDGQGDLRAEAAGFRGARPAADPIGLGLIAAGNQACVFGVERAHADRPVPELGPQLLLDTGEVAVEIDVQAFQRIGLLHLGLQTRTKIEHLV